MFYNKTANIVQSTKAILDLLANDLIDVNIDVRTGDYE